MSNHAEYYSLAAVVDQWLIDNDLPNNFFPKGLSWAIRGLRELNFDSWADVKTILLDVSDRKTVVLPTDFVAWSKIGLKHGQYALNLSENNDLAITNREANEQFIRGLPKYGLPTGVDFSNYSNMSYANYNGMTLNAYGTGFMTKGSFKVNDNGQCKELLLDYDYPMKQIYLEYITDGFCPIGVTIIHPYVYDYLIKYIDAKWEDKANPNATESSILRRNREVADAERKVRARGNNVDPDTLLNIVRANTTLALKM